MTMVETSPEWADLAKRILRAEMVRSGINYAQLAEKLTAMGLDENEGSVKARINRGTFPAWFLIAAVKALGRDVLRLD